MKKYTFILMGLLLPFSQAFAQQSTIQSTNDINEVNLTTLISSSGLKVTWPIDRMVVQRNQSDQAVVSIAIQYSDFSNVLSNTVSAYYSIVKMDNATGENEIATVKAWSPLSNLTTVQNLEGEFRCLMNETLDKGWYQLRVKLVTQANNQVAFKRIKFGVGDVYFIAGQSNAAGYEWGSVDQNIYSDEGLIPFTSNYTQMDAVSFLQGNNYAPNGQLSTSYPIKGFPIQEKSFSKLIAGDNNNVQQIYPNGRHSWCWAPLGSKIVESTNVPVMFFNGAVPGTSTNSWVQNSSGNYYIEFNRFRSLMQIFGGTLGTRGVLWHQGENDASLQSRNPAVTNFDYYNNKIKNAIEQSRYALLRNSSDPSLNWFMSMASYYSDPKDATNQTGGNYCVYNNNPPTGVPPFAITPPTGGFTQNVCTDITAGSPAYNYTLVNSQNSTFSGSSTISGVKSGVFTDDIGGDGNRNSYRKIHFSGNALKTVADRWYDKMYPGNNPVSNPISGNTLSGINVIYLGSGNFKLSAPEAPNRKYFWTMDNEGIYNPFATSREITVNNITHKNKVFICYFSDDNDPDGGNSTNQDWDLRLKATQPFAVPSTTQSLFSTTYTYNFTGNSGVFNLSSSNVIWDITNLPNWITVTNNSSGGDGDFSINLAFSPTSANRTATIRVQEAGGGIYKDFSITQAATTTCQTYLSTLPTSSVYMPDWGTLHLNKSVENNTLTIGGQAFASGLGTHAYSNIKYALNGQYNSFSGFVGLDDEVGNGCGGTQQVKFVVKADGVELWNSGVVSTSTGKVQIGGSAQGVSVSGKTQLELIVEPLANIYCDHADWVDVALSCGTSSCTSPANPTVFANPSTISSGSSTTLTANCVNSTPYWQASGQTSTTITVSPTATTSYSAKCKSLTGNCESGLSSVTVTVGGSSGGLLTAGSCYTIKPKLNQNNQLQAMGDNSVQQQSASSNANQVWIAEASGSQWKFKTATTNAYIQVSNSNYGNQMYVGANTNNIQAWNVNESGGFYRLADPTYNVTWDMAGYATQPNLQNWGNTSEGFLDYRLWKFTSVGCPSNSASLTNNTCYVIKSAATNLPMQAMSDGFIKKQNANGQSNQVWKAVSSGSQWKFQSMSNSQFIDVANGNYGQKMTLTANGTSWNIANSSNAFRISNPSNNITWDMEGAGSGDFLQNWGNTSEGFINYRLWSFESTSCPTSGTACTPTNLTLANAAYYSTAYGINNNLNQNGGALIVNGAGYPTGIGTHANSEIIYNLPANHAHNTLSVDVGRDQGSYGCNCGTQQIVFKIVNNSTGAVIAGPITKTINQPVSTLSAPISGVSSIKLVVEDGGDQVWGDWADWINPKLNCSNNGARMAATDSVKTEIDLFQISPNPNDGKFGLRIDAPTAGQMQFYLSRSNGAVLHRFTENVTQGINQKSVTIPNLMQGVYLLTGQLGEVIQTKRLVIE